MKIVVKGDPSVFFSQVNDCEDQWTPTEDQNILEVKKVSSKPWTELASLLNRSPSACYGRYDELVNKPPSHRRGTVRKRIFTADKPGKRSKVANPSVFQADDWKVGSTRNTDQLRSGDGSASRGLGDALTRSTLRRSASF